MTLVTVYVTADAGALLCFEGLANVEAFWGNEQKARALYEEGHTKKGATSRYLRGWALFEKKQADLQVSTSQSFRLTCFVPLKCKSATPNQ